MNLKIGKSNNRTYLSIVHGYRDKETKQVRTKTIKSLGYLDELEKKHPGTDVIAHYREVARQMTEDEKTQQKVTLTIDMNEALEAGTDNRLNVGYAAILKVYYDLKLDQFFRNDARNYDFKYSPNSIMTMLVVSRLLSPGSKLKAYEERSRYFERFDFALVDVYRCLSYFAGVEMNVQRHINEQISACYGKRNTKTIYYDVTNYYFEIDKEDELRKRGFSKENKKAPIVQMGLAMDADGIPLHYEMFPGNTPDTSTFRSVVGEVRRKYDTGRIIVVADMGIISGDNIYYLTGGEKKAKTDNGYVLSFSVRGGTGEFKEYVLDNSGYLDKDSKPATEDSEFKIKSSLIAREIYVTMSNGKTKKKTVYEKQVVFWSKKYAGKARADREKIIQKAKAYVSNPGRYKNATAKHGAAKYVENIEVAESTGEVIESEKTLVFNELKLLEDEALDGYYSIVTSEKDMPDDEIIDTYRGLWEIEETFRVTKSTLEARPVFLSREERVRAHFLTCFISLVIVRLLQKLTGKCFSSEEIVNCLSRISCSHEADNIYLFDYRSDTADAIGQAVGLDFTRKRLRLNDIKNIIANAKS